MPHAAYAVVVRGVAFFAAQRIDMKAYKAEPSRAHPAAVWPDRAEVRLYLVA